MGIKNKILELFTGKSKIERIPEQAVSDMQEKIEQIDDETQIKPSDIIKKETLGVINQTNDPKKQHAILESLGEKIEEKAEEMDELDDVTISNAFEKIEQDDNMSQEQALKLFNGFSDEMKKYIIDRYIEDVHEKDNFKFQKEMIKTLDDDELREEALEKLSIEERVKEEALRQESLENLEEIYNYIWEKNVPENSELSREPSDFTLGDEIEEAIKTKIDTEEIIKAKLKVIAKQSAQNYAKHGINFLSHFTKVVSPKNMYKHTIYFYNRILEEYKKIKKENVNSINIEPQELIKLIKNEIIKNIKDEERRQSENKTITDIEENLKNSTENFRIKVFYRTDIETKKNVSEALNTCLDFSEEDLNNASVFTINMGKLQANERTETLKIVNQEIEKRIKNKEVKEAEEKAKEAKEDEER